MKANNCKCKVCGAGFYRAAYRLSIGGGVYCSVKCRNLGRRKSTGKKNAHLRFAKSSGRFVRQWWQPETKKQTSMQNSQWIWEMANCRLPSGYCVHHIDENKLNDELGNLRLMKKGDHVRLHLKGKGKKPVTLINGIPYWACAKCGTLYPVESYRLYKKTGKRDGRCSECERERRRNDYKRKKQERQEQNNEH